MPNYLEFIVELSDRIRKGEKLSKALKDVVLKHDKHFRAKAERQLQLMAKAKEQQPRRPLAKNFKDEIPF